jgi:hypothetical protein
LTFFAPEIPKDKLQKVISAGVSQVVDLRDRSEAEKRGGYINIPADELSVRSKAELESDRPVYLDCSDQPIFKCRGAGRLLIRQGFKDVTVIRP